MVSLQSFEAFFTIENLTNADWREASSSSRRACAASRPEGVDDIHFTPGTPRSFFGGIAFHF